MLSGILGGYLIIGILMALYLLVSGQIDEEISREYQENAESQAIMDAYKANLGPGPAYVLVVIPGIISIILGWGLIVYEWCRKKK